MRSVPTQIPLVCLTVVLGGCAQETVTQPVRPVRAIQAADISGSVDPQDPLCPDNRSHAIRRYNRHVSFPVMPVTAVDANPQGGGAGSPRPFRTRPSGTWRLSNRSRVFWASNTQSPFRHPRFLGRVHCNRVTA